MPSGLDWIGLPSNSATKCKLTPKRFTMVIIIPKTEPEILSSLNQRLMPAKEKTRTHAAPKVP